MAEYGEILRPVVHAGSLAIFVHDDVEAPMQPVFHAPVSAGDGIEVVCGERLDVVGGS